MRPAILTALVPSASTLLSPAFCSGRGVRHRRERRRRLYKEAITLEHIKSSADAACLPECLLAQSSYPACLRLSGPMFFAGRFAPRLLALALCRSCRKLLLPRLARGVTFAGEWTGQHQRHGVRRRGCLEEALEWQGFRSSARWASPALSVLLVPLAPRRSSAACRRPALGPATKPVRQISALVRPT